MAALALIRIVDERCRPRDAVFLTASALAADSWVASRTTEAMLPLLDDGIEKPSLREVRTKMSDVARRCSRANW